MQKIIPPILERKKNKGKHLLNQQEGENSAISENLSKE
jgi:hypothetical protein